MPAPGWARIRDPQSNGGEPVTNAYVNLAQAEGIGVHVEGDRRVIKVRFPDSSERTLDGDFDDDQQAMVVVVGLIRSFTR